MNCDAGPMSRRFITKYDVTDRKWVDPVNYEGCNFFCNFIFMIWLVIFFIIRKLIQLFKHKNEPFNVQISGFYSIIYKVIHVQFADVCYLC